MLAAKQGARMKTILTPVESHSFMPSVFASAALLARRFGGYIEGAALGPDIPDLAATDFPIGGAMLDEGARREMFEHALAAFEAAMQAHGVARRRVDAAAPSFGWAGAHLIDDSGIGSFGRVFDLIVVGRPGPNPNHPRRATLESALFDSGRPILVAPPRPPAAIGETIVIAWNASTETARSVAFASPLLAAAKEVIVLSVTGAMTPGPSGAELARRLRMDDVRARDILVTPAPKVAAGQTMLDTAASLGADLLIKGGYTQSRLRQLIFGGPTSHILAHADLPVFMAH